MLSLGPSEPSVGEGSLVPSGGEGSLVPSVGDGVFESVGDGDLLSVGDGVLESLGDGDLGSVGDGECESLGFGLGLGFGTTGVSFSGTTTSGFAPWSRFGACDCGPFEPLPLGALFELTVRRVESIIAFGCPEIFGR